MVKKIYLFFNQQWLSFIDDCCPTILNGHTHKNLSYVFLQCSVWTYFIGKTFMNYFKGRSSKPPLDSSIFESAPAYFLQSTVWYILTVRYSPHVGRASCSDMRYDQVYRVPAPPITVTPVRLVSVWSFRFFSFDIHRVQCSFRTNVHFQ